jgi:hypothetical protein
VEGVTDIEAIVAALLQEYEVPPLAVNVVDCPEQMKTGELALTVGKVFTVTATELVDVHPAAFEAVTV